ncbi:MAG: hypothetical protein QHH27_03405 [Clostridia bacterium]|jgi:hypothetical protein|nr:hypothetical protein [Clostridia bacterium]MDH7572584.1 hypothetical protein [Clostridia bacterium]
MDKVKSALEIALERSQRVAQQAGSGREWEEQQHRLVGENLARRYLRQEIDVRALRSAVERQPDRAGKAVAKAATAALAREIRLENYDRLLDGIAALREDEEARRWLEETRRACRQFAGELAAEEREAASRRARRAQEELARLGISGTAIAGLNPRKAGESLRQVWDERLAGIRERLVRFLEG